MAKITKRYCEGRKSPYQLFWIEDGVRHSRFFETKEAREDFLRLNGHLDKRSFEALLGIDENTISDISYIESIRGERKFPRYVGILGKEPQIKACINPLGRLRRISAGYAQD